MVSEDVLNADCRGTSRYGRALAEGLALLSFVVVDGPSGGSKAGFEKLFSCLAGPGFDREASMILD